MDNLDKNNEHLHSGCCQESSNCRANFGLGLLAGIAISSVLILVMIFIYMGKVGAPGIASNSSTSKKSAPEFEKCLSSVKYDGQIEADSALGEKLGITGTPNFFLNGYQITGALPLDYLKTVVDALIAGKTPPSFSADEKIVKVTLPEEALVGHTIGSDKAKVTMVIFDDFQCPYCAKFSATEQELLKAYPNDLKIVFKHFPLSFHQYANLAARAAECAGDQNKFWEMHEQLFKINLAGNFTEESITATGGELDLK